MNPLRVAAILRHSDIADESNAATRTVQTERCIEVLNDKLDQLARVSSTDIDASGLNDVVERANEIAKDTGTYYSALIGLKIDARIALAGIGHVKAWLCRRGEFSTLLEPTIMPVPNEGGGPRVLTAALGVGFDPERIQGCETELRGKEFVVIAFETELAKEPTDFETIDDATQILDRIVNNITNKAPAIIVVTA